ncbi:sulfotransferase family protein [Robertkochia solimangrovi]|uniref:sulfotransferase family protein n=1 Tax=Robertkochia solimangrovi TaxID=2213046 RepID=UPI0013A55109|nr:sulfotransferase [Robertkochia solimangrovi]
MVKDLKSQLDYKLNRSKYEFYPVFLIGCGRSGTTILGETLGKHSDISYLNERRDLWHQAYPEFDIWSDNVENPKLIAEKKDHINAKTDLLQFLFHKEQVKDRCKVLLEKLPINNFRLEFLNEAFPDAKYIYLHRNGLEVATSIEKLANAGNWYGENSSKWKLLNDLIKNNEEFQDFKLDNFEKGLLEWRFSLERSEMFFESSNPANLHRLSYKSFIDNPEFQLKMIFDFLELDLDVKELKMMAESINRKSKIIHEITDKERLLGGVNLELSVKDELRVSYNNPE